MHRNSALRDTGGVEYPKLGYCGNSEVTRPLTTKDATMALTHCGACGMELSSDAEVCPSCSRASRSSGMSAASPAGPFFRKPPPAHVGSPPPAKATVDAQPEA